MDIVIKKIETESEVEGKACVHWKTWQEAYSGIVDQSFLDSLTLQKCLEIASSKKDGILIAIDGERVVGFAGYGACRGDDLPSCGEIQAIYVLPEYWGKGVGASLMEAALRELEEYPSVALWVLKENSRAIRFYEKCGFHADGAGETIMLGSPVTEIRMVRSMPGDPMRDG